MVIYDSGDSSNLITALEANLSGAQQIFDRLSKGSQHLIGVIDSGTLSGAAYKAGQTLFVAYINPMLQKLNQAIADIQGDLKSYQSADSAISAVGNHLDSDQIQELLKLTQNMIDLVEQKIKDDRDFINQFFSGGFKKVGNALAKLPDLYDQLENLKELKATRKKELKALETFSSSTNSLFQDSLRAFENAMKGVDIINQSTANSDGTITFPAGADMSWATKLGDEKFSSDLSIEDKDLKNIYQDEFGFDKATTGLIVKIQNMIDEKYPNKSEAEKAYLFNWIMGSFFYGQGGMVDQVMWQATAGSGINFQDIHCDTQTQLLSILKYFGLSQKEIEELSTALQNQHLFSSPPSLEYLREHGFPNLTQERYNELVKQFSGKADFVHQSITEATQFMVTPDRIKELSGWRGDVTNGAGKTPSMNNDDYKADLDAINIKIMMEKLKISQSEATQQYYNDLKNGKYTRASMFNDNMGLKYVKDSILKSFGVSTMDELKIKSIVSFNFIKSLESNSNDLIGG